MKEKNLIIKTIQLLIIILLYHIIGSKDLFPYVLSFSLYKIFSSCFTHLTFKDSFNNFKENYYKSRFLNLSILTISVISALFLILSILISDLSSYLLKIDSMFLTFLFMGLSIIASPLLKLLTEYLEATKRKNKSVIIKKIYYSLESILMIILSFLSFRVFKISRDLSFGLLYLPKIISILSVLIFVFLIIQKDLKDSQKINIKYNYKLELKKILTQNYTISIINIIKNSYYYISLIIVYIILSTRYKYAINIINEDLSLIYFYFLAIINYLVEIVNLILKNNNASQDISHKLYTTLKNMLPLVIIFSIISPLSTKLIFNAPEKSIYLVMLNFLALFISLYDLTINNAKNKKILYISLFTGLIIKLVITIPLINAFYRMGYNLIYGDITSTIVSFIITIIINRMANAYEKNKKENYLDNILNTLYENIILTIILIVLEFIIPIKTNNYFQSLLLLIIYLLVSYSYFKIKKKFIK